jgi:GDP-mannose 6-dehydrogenase
MNPEFMREGVSIEDFSTPPFTVIGQLDRWSGDRVEALYRTVNAPVYRTSIRVAEMLKYACNSFHALKVTFANEIGNICKTAGIDGHEVMRLMCRDTKLNLSDYYLKPGFAFGGSCLPKDLRALLQYTKQSDLNTPLLSSILPSNKNQIERAYKLIAKTGRKRVGVLGLSFKPATDDLRESPIAELIEALIGKGYSLKIYDEEVSLAGLTGRNKRYIDRLIPHISRLMEPSLDTVIEHADVMVISKAYRSWESALASARKEIILIDLVRALPDPGSQGPNYRGICW